MALSILDGNQSATTLSTILSSGQHITAHTVVSLGTQAITDIVNATSANLTNTQLRASAVTVGGTVTVGNSLTISSLPAISGTVTANVGNAVVIQVVNAVQDGDGTTFGIDRNFPVDIISAIPAGTNRIGVVTASLSAGTAQIGSVTVGNSVTIGSLPNVKIQGFNGAGGGQYIDVGVTEQGSVSVTLESALPAGTAQIGSVTASISGTVPISISSVTVGNSVTIASLPAISGTVTANLGTATVQIVNAIQDGEGETFGIDRDFPVSGSVQIQAGLNQIGSVTANTFAIQGTAVTTSNFTSTTASTVLANFNATREVLTIFNEGAGNLHICAGATCTTIAYQVRLSAGDYYEVPNHQTTITHSAVFATAGTARICQLS